MPGGENIEFSAILASAVHDIKNSLAMLLNTIDQLGACGNEQCRYVQERAALRYEAQRVNNDLIQLLTLYKLGSTKYTLDVDYHSIDDFFAERWADYAPLFAGRGIELQRTVEKDLCWFFDAYLIGSVVNNVLNNAIRYAQGKVLLSATVQDGCLLICLEDDGAGYPADVVAKAGQIKNGHELPKGGTGLGLYFATLAASQHQKNGCVGHIQLSNGSRLGGGRFAIVLP